MIHGPARFWPKDGWCLLPNDRGQIASIGPSPFKGFSFYQPSDWAWLKSQGFLDIGIRLWHERGRLPTPDIFVTWHATSIDPVLRLGLQPWVQLLNEPNLELWGMTSTEVCKWLQQVIVLLRQRYPHLELVSPPLCPSLPNTYTWLNDLTPAIRLCDTLGVDYYWQTEADLAPTRPFCPEWMHQRFPDLPMRLMECGGADGTSRDWRHNTYPTMLARYAKLPWLRSVHPFILSSEDPAWERLGHTYDPAVVSLLHTQASSWRNRPLVRTYPVEWKIGNLVVHDLRQTLPKHPKKHYDTRLPGDIKAIVVHHVGAEVSCTAEQIARYHIDHNDWPGVGYHLYVKRSGIIQYLNDWSKVTYHVSGRNKEFLGICQEGDLDHYMPTKAQVDQTRLLVANLQYAFGVWWYVYGHCEVALPSNPSTCPGRFWQGWKHLVQSRPTVK